MGCLDDSQKELRGMVRQGVGALAAHSVLPNFPIVQCAAGVLMLPKSLVVQFLAGESSVGDFPIETCLVA
jgi:hypothetical protein